MLFPSKIKDDLEPIIKWAGGKEKELKYILPRLPAQFTDYYEPFVGGGSVFTAINADRYFINDKSTELMRLYDSIKRQDSEFFSWIELIAKFWGNIGTFLMNSDECIVIYISLRNGDIAEAELKSRICDFIHDKLSMLSLLLPDGFIWYRNRYIEELQDSITDKMRRMHRIEKEKGILGENDVKANIETAFRSAAYAYLRALYNDKELLNSVPQLDIAVFYFIRNFAYSGMFRYNKNNEFNVPYGGIGYNNKDLKKKILYYKSDLLKQHFNNTVMENLDFEDFFKLHQPTEEDFIFLDPPYDSKFNTYAQNEFSLADQERLADFLCNKCKSQWMMIIKNTPFIMSLYANRDLSIMKFDKKYQVSFMNRNDKNVEHLLIMNY